MMMWKMPPPPSWRRSPAHGRSPGTAGPPPPPDNHPGRLIDPRECPDTVEVKFIATNPKRPGTACNLRYEAYKDATTVKEFLEKGGWRADRVHDVNKNYCARGTKRCRHSHAAAAHQAPQVPPPSNTKKDSDDDEDWEKKPEDDDSEDGRLRRQPPGEARGALSRRRPGLQAPQPGPAGGHARAGFGSRPPDARRSMPPKLPAPAPPAVRRRKGPRAARRGRARAAGAGAAGAGGRARRRRAAAGAGGSRGAPRRRRRLRRRRRGASSAATSSAAATSSPRRPRRAGPPPDGPPPSADGRRCAKQLCHLRLHLGSWPRGLRRARPAFLPRNSRR